MAKKFEFSIVALFKDLASRGLKGLQRTLGATNKLAFGRGGLIGTLGLGGLATGGLFGPVIGAAKLAVSGVVSIVKAGIGAAVSAVKAAVSVVTGLIGSVLRTVKRLVIAGALGSGALLGYTLIQGIRENMRLADLRQVLRKLLGAAWKDAEQYARQLSLRTPFTPFEMIEAVSGLAAVRLSYREFLRDVADWAAGAHQPLEMVLSVFQRAATGQFGEAMESARRALISMRDLQAQGAQFAGGNRFTGTPEQFIASLVGAVRARFGGMAEAAAEVGGGPWSTFVGAIQDLRVQLTEPWYERFNVGLKELNAWLLELAASEKWANIVAWSGRLADALDRRLRAAIEWLTTRQWSWDALKAGFRDLVATVPDIGRAVMDQLGVLANKIETLFWGVWGRVGDGLVEVLSRSLRRVSEALNKYVARGLQDATEAAARRAYEVWAREKGPGGPPTPWEELPEGARETWRRGREPGVIASAKLGELGKLAQALGGMAVRLSDTPEQADVAAQRLAALNEQLAELERRAEASRAALGAGLGGAAATAFPGPPPPTREELIAQVLAASPELAALRERAGRKAGVAGLLHRTGPQYEQRAGELAEEARLLHEEVTRVLGRIIDDGVVTKKELRALRRDVRAMQARLNKLAMARA